MPSAPLDNPHALLLRGPLHSAARRLLQGERRGHTLQPTALLHEAFLRLRRSAASAPGADFHAGAIVDLYTQAMRWVLIDHARRRRSRLCATGNVVAQQPAAAELDFSSLLQAIEKLRNVAPRRCKVIELRILAGLSVAEVAATLGVTDRTVVRDHAAALTQLRALLSEEDPLRD